jgi:phosphatidylglycerophosphate synthase
MEVFYISTMLAFFIAPFILAKLWYWVIFLAIIIVALGVIELIAVLKTKQTISQQFVEYMKKNKWKAILIMLSGSIGWGMLVSHLLFEIP